MFGSYLRPRKYPIMVETIGDKIFNTMRIESKVELAYKLIPHATKANRREREIGGRDRGGEHSMKGDAKSAGKNFCWPKITKWQEATRRRGKETKKWGDTWKIKTK